MTPAVDVLKRAKHGFELLEYESEPKEGNFGLLSAQKLGLPSEQVFKTLMACNEQNPKQMLVAIVPSDKHLDLKALAKAAGFKRVQMCELASAERSSGYVRGGISPFGQKRQWPTYLDASASEFAQIIVSGGRRGLSLALAPQSIIDILNAHYAPLGVHV